MKPTPFALLFAAACVVLGFTGLSVRRDASPPVADFAPAARPTDWPDFSPRGPGFRVPQGSDGPLIAYGHDMMTRTFAIVGPEVSDPAMRFAGNNLSCQNCHLDAGTNRHGLPLVGLYRAFPRPLPSGKGEETLVDRLNQCMTHSLNGRALPPDSNEMQAMIAYMRYIGDPPPAPELPPAPPPPSPPDASRGATVYATVCAACHQPDGAGKRSGGPNDAMGYVFPPLWGPDSFNDRAGFDLERRMVPFVLRNMPTGVDPQHPQLSAQQAWDVSAYVLSQPRPRNAGPRSGQE